MDPETLVRQFGKDPGSAFVDINRASPKPIPAQGIKQQLIDAGMKKDDIDRHWRRVQPLIKLHPHIAMANNKYEWLTERRSAQISLDLLAGRVTARLPGWLTTRAERKVVSAVQGRSGDR